MILVFFQNLGKCPAIACNEVIGTGLLSAFKKDIVAPESSRYFG
jgi:hypothetical protein